MSLAGLSVSFKAMQALIETEDISDLQALAVRQVQAGAWCLDVTSGREDTRTLDSSRK